MIFLSNYVIQHTATDLYPNPFKAPILHPDILKINLLVHCKYAVCHIK